MASRWGELEFATSDNRRSLARAAQRGTVARLAAGVYSGLVDADPVELTRRLLLRIVEHERPGVVITDASARTGEPRGGVLHAVSASPMRPLDLPGVTVRIRTGPGPQPGDMALAGNVYLASPARGLLDNLAVRRGSASRVMSRAEVEDWIDDLARSRGEHWLQQLRNQARALASPLRRHREFVVLDGLIGAALGSRDDVSVAGLSLRSRAAGTPIDTERVELFSQFADWLDDQPPNLLIDEPNLAERRRLLPFYEAYFSNFIEGTEFTLDEAAEIVFDHQTPPGRPADAHDVLATYEIVSDSTEMTRLPGDADELVELLRARHRVLMAARPEKGPGEFKHRANHAGQTIFVEPDLVAGTLRAGFEHYQRLSDPFTRAAFTMFFLAEVHPFTDGNGRLARIFMNAELVAAQQVRIIIPTVYREDHLSGLRAVTRTRQFPALYRVLDYARRYTAGVDFSSQASAERDFERTNALMDPREAERDGLRLQLPRGSAAGTIGVGGGT
jgi:hypothetical protein